MPTVSQYQRQVQQSAAPSARLNPVNFQVSPDDLDGGASRGLTQLGRQAAEIASQERKKANQMAILDADTRLGQFETTRLYDPESGALNQRGEDAFDLPDTVLQDYDALVAEVEKGLSTDEQRLSFQRLAQDRRQNINRAVQRHVAGEVQRYDDQTVQSSLEVSRNNAVANWSDSERVRLELARQTAIITDHADRNGLPAEYVQAETQKIRSGTQVSILDRMVSSDPAGAREYYNAIKEDLTASDQSRAETIVKERALAYEADAVAQQIADGGGDQYSAWLEEANTIEDPDLRRRVKEGLDQRWREVQVQRDEMVAEAYQAIENGSSPQDIPISQWEQMPNAARRGLEQRYREVQQGIEPAQDDRAWLEVSDMSTRDLADMGQGELYDSYRSRLDDAHWNSLVAQWQDARAVARGEAGDDVIARLSNTLTFKDRVRSAGVESGILRANKTPSEYSATEVQRYARFQEEAARRIEDEELSRGRKLTGNEQQEIIDQMTIETVFVDRTLAPDPEVPVSALLEDEAGAAYVPINSIPPEATARMVSFAEQNGWRLGRNRDDRLERAYAAALRGDDDTVAAILRGD